MPLDNSDPNIPLQAGNIPRAFQQGLSAPGQNLNQLLALQMRAQQLRQVQQSENALRTLYGNPQNLDETGRPTKNALAELMRASPQAGLQVQNQLATLDTQKAHAEGMQGQVAQQHRKAGYEILKAGISAYDDALKETNNPQRATQAANETVAEMKGEYGSNGMLPKEYIARIPGFDPVKWRAMASSYETANTKPLTQAERVRLGFEGEKIDLEKKKLILAEDKQDQGKITKDEMGRPIVVNPKTGISRPVQAEGGQPTAVTGAGSATAETHGEDYLKTLDKDQQNQVKALAEGRMQFPGGFALRSPYWQRMLSEVSQYDPSFDTVNFNARSATRRDFTSGQSARNITSFNTAIGHLGTLKKAADALGNSWSDYWNKLANFVIERKGDPRVREFETAKSAVADELTRSFRLTGGNVHDIVAWEENLNAANSPAQLHGAIKQAVDLLRSRIENVGQQYNKGMGTTSDPLELLTPKSKDTIKMLEGGEQKPSDKKEAPAPDANAPTKQGDAPPEEMVKGLPDGTVLRNEHGDRYQVKGGKAVKL